jgi:hypothetical protein
LFVLLFFFFWPLCCLFFFDKWINLFFFNLHLYIYSYNRTSKDYGHERRVMVCNICFDYMEYVSHRWYDILELVVPIMMIEGCCYTISVSVYIFYM